MLAIHLDSQVVGYSLVGKKLIRSDEAYFIWAMSKAVLSLIICWVNEELIKFVRDFRLDLGQTWVKSFSYGFSIEKKSRSFQTRRNSHLAADIVTVCTDI